MCKRQQDQKCHKMGQKGLKIYEKAKKWTFWTVIGFLDALASLDLKLSVGK